MRKFIADESADVKMIGAVVGILVTLIVAVLVFYNIAGSIDTTTIDSNFGDYGLGRYAQGGSLEQINGSTPADNATTDTLAQAATFFSVAPIIAIVVVAVVILGYVGRIGG